MTVLALVATLFLALSCEKEGSIGRLVGTWDIDYGREVENGLIYLEITQTTIVFHWDENHAPPTSVTYDFKYDHPHLYLMGNNLWDIESMSKKAMVWKTTAWWGEGNDNQRWYLTKRKK